MKRIIVTAFAAVCCIAGFAAGTVRDNLTLYSAILKTEKKYAVYLPEGSETSARRYPVLYLLHGSGDDQSAWIQFGEVCRIADQAIAQGKAAPMIIVMPDAGGERKGYFNDPKGEWRYEDYFFEELIPHIEKSYPCYSHRFYRAIAGLSLGGGGALYYALHRPDMFAAACPLSCYAGLDKQDVVDCFTFWGMDFSGLGQNAIQPWFDRYNVEALTASADPQTLEKWKAIGWWVDCGDDDYLYRDSSQIHILFREKEIPHEYRVRDGGHSWTYWRESLPLVLEFVSIPFRRL